MDFDLPAHLPPLLQSLDEAAQELRAAEDYLESCKAFAISTALSEFALAAASAQVQTDT